MMLVRNLLFLLSVLFLIGLSAKPLSAQITNTEGEQLKKQLQQRLSNPKPYNPETAQRIRNSKIQQQRAMETKRQQAGNPGAPSKERLNPQTGSNTGFRPTVQQQQSAYRQLPTPPAPSPQRAPVTYGQLPAQSTAPKPASAPLPPSSRPAAPLPAGAPAKPQSPKPSYSAGFPRANNPRPSAQPRPTPQPYNGKANPYAQRPATPASGATAQRPKLSGGDPNISAPKAQYVKPAILNTSIQQRNALTKDMSQPARQAFQKKYRDAKASHQRHLRSAQRPAAQRPAAQRPATPAQPANLKRGHGKLPPAPAKVGQPNKVPSASPRPNQATNAKRSNAAGKSNKKAVPVKGRRGPR